MKHGKQFGKILAGVIAAALLFTPVKAFAADSAVIDETKDCRIALSYKDRDNVPITDMRVRVYQVATAKGEILGDNDFTLHYTLTSQFTKYEQTGSMPITGFSESALNEALKIREGESPEDRLARWQSIALTLSSPVRADATPQGDKKTGTDGSVVFEGLKPGLYLVIADGATVTEPDALYRYTYHPTFIALPRYVNGAWEYGMDLGMTTMSPKCDYERVPREEYEYFIYKRWVNDGGTARPTNIRVDLYRNGAFYQTIYLNEANGWNYSWKSVGAYSWYAVERTTNTGYSVSMSVDGRAITFTNTYTPPPPPPPPPPETPPPENPPPPEEEDVLGARREESEVLGARRSRATEDAAVLGARRLPRSGQLWWPVPILAGTGIILFAAGAARRRKSTETGT